jgi:isochorismate synthase
MESAYFAYRFPGEEETHFMKGKLVVRKTFEELDPEGITICSFDRKNLQQLQDAQPILKEDFQISFSQGKPATVEREAYQEMFEKVKQNILDGSFKKIVLSRTKVLKNKLDPTEILDKLNQRYKNTFNYIFTSESLGCWMGATPELLYQMEKGLISSVSLAGTKTSDEKWTEKEIQEQLYVTNYIKDALANIGAEDLDIKGPATLEAGPVDHLKSVITAKLPESLWKEAISELHPTPATCGIPAQSSMEFIVDTEKHDRKFYTGFIGMNYQDAKMAFVNLRCMELYEGEALIYVGGGMTAQSELDREWQETERKSKTLEAILK